MTEPALLGTAIVAYMEPHAGLEREFNRWYEGDHYYAAVMAGPGVFAGGRWVATRACKARRPAGSLFGDPARGSYLAAYWVYPGAQADWDAWVVRRMEALTEQDRLFPGRDHVHTAVYGLAFEARHTGGPPAALALDRCFPGVIALAARATTAKAEAWARGVVGDEIPVAVGLVPERVVMSQAEPGAHVLVLAFCDADPLAVWRARVAPALAALDGVGFASPFLRTEPGTDRYVDEL